MRPEYKLSYFSVLGTGYEPTTDANGPTINHPNLSLQVFSMFWFDDVFVWIHHLCNTIYVSCRIFFSRLFFFALFYPSFWHINLDYLHALLGWYFFGPVGEVGRLWLLQIVGSWVRKPLNLNGENVERLPCLLLLYILCLVMCECAHYQGIGISWRQSDQIWRNSTTLAKFKSLNNFLSV